MFLKAEQEWDRTIETLNEGAYTEYRIPGIVVSQRGTLIMCYEGRMSHGDWARLDTVVLRSTDDGGTWTRTTVRIPAALGGTDDDTVNNPTLTVDGDRIHLIFHQDYARAFHTLSTDDGMTWSEPVEITEAYRQFPYPWNVCATGPGHGIRLQSGRLIAPVWLANGQCLGGKQIAHQPSVAGSVYSDDHGRTWKTGALVGGILNANETTVAELPDGRVLYNFRNCEADSHRRIAVSPDGGETLSAPRSAEDLPDPMCFGSMTVFGGCILYSGCVRENSDVRGMRARTDLTMMVSSDSGNTWRKLVKIDDIGGYSDLAAAGDSVYVLYEQTSPVTGHIDRLALKKYRLIAEM